MKFKSYEKNTSEQNKISKPFTTWKYDFLTNSLPNSEIKINSSDRKSNNISNNSRKNSQSTN